MLCGWTHNASCIDVWIPSFHMAKSRIVRRGRIIIEGHTHEKYFYFVHFFHSWDFIMLVEAVVLKENGLPCQHILCIFTSKLTENHRKLMDKLVPTFLSRNEHLISNFVVVVSNFLIWPMFWDSVKLIGHPLCRLCLKGDSFRNRRTNKLIRTVRTAFLRETTTGTT